MSAADRTTTLLALVGSLRRASHSAAVLRAVAAAAPADVTFDTARLDALPFYNADLDGDPSPDSVQALRAQVERCDGILIVTPEYNHGLPAVLKNAIDWASRPAYTSALKDKPVGFVTLSPGQFGGIRAQAHLQQLFAATLSRQINAPQVAIAHVGAKVHDGVLTDPDACRFAQGVVMQLLALVATQRGAAG
ncbi:NADPH-dependent FMN reductase [Burkholderia sp. 22PA0106]|uniref:NADPH-dependent FMN reductase n=1 Tax=Burkholderia sp. 22PA0106 TaxID=3237371 RepID=UPI0039C1BD11